jgi:hypothetical protein
MGMTDEDILGIIFAKDKEKGKLFWPELGVSVVSCVEIVSTMLR